MVFTEPAFLFLFLPILLGVYFLFGRFRSLRNPLLLLASLFFYAWGEKFFVLMMVGSILFNYGVGLWIGKRKNTSARQGKWPISVGIVGNITFLAVFKYADFIVANLNGLFDAIGTNGLTMNQPDIDLPIGISFFTFQSMSYLVDVYRGNAEAQRKLVDLALYISLFPQLIAGPIVRYKEIVGQIVLRRVTRGDFADGVRRFIIGLGKKALIADTCGKSADSIFGFAGAGSAAEWGGLTGGVPLEQLTPGLAWLAIICFTLQIYFDFSGYSDMALGLGRMFGFRFRENFNFPYVSQSISEFWRRWHISLSSWFRDYLYIPLGGNRGPRWMTYRNLLFVFLLCGLWHGASWNFVIWGMFHGGFLVLEQIGLGAALTKTFRPLRHSYVVVVVLVGWVIFRSESLAQVSAMLGALIGFAPGDGIAHHVGLHMDRQLALAVLLGVVGSTPLFPRLQQWRDKKARSMRPERRAIFFGATAVCTHSMLAVIFLVSAVYVASGSYSPFIYFRF